MCTLPSSDTAFGSGEPADDHLIDSQLSNDRRNRTVSDHAQLVAEIRLL